MATITTNTFNARITNINFSEVAEPELEVLRDYLAKRPEEMDIIDMSAGNPGDVSYHPGTQPALYLGSIQNPVTRVHYWLYRHTKCGVTIATTGDGHTDHTYCVRPLAEGAFGRLHATADEIKEAEKLMTLAEWATI